MDMPTQMHLTYLKFKYKKRNIYINNAIKDLVAKISYSRNHRSPRKVKEKCIVEQTPARVLGVSGWVGCNLNK